MLEHITGEQVARLVMLLIAVWTMIFGSLALSYLSDRWRR